MTRVLLLCPERVRPTMAGVGIRFVEMARTLASRFDVVLGVPNPPEQAPDLGGARVERYWPETIDQLTSHADAVVVHGHVSDVYLDHGHELPMVVDLYDPFPIENLNYFDTLGDEPYRRDRATLERQLRHGDLFLCSSEEQRLFYLGMLFTIGRLNPQRYWHDFSLANLVRVVPFGVPEEPAAAHEPVLRGVVPGIGEHDPVLLFGGIYDWYDPLLLLRCLPELLAHHADLRVVFAANPNPDSTPQGAYADVLQASADSGWTGSHVFFVPWVPYARRASLYLECTVATVLHRRRFETEVSLRTRTLDHLWAGLPTVVTAGGTMSRLVAEHQLGLVVGEDDAAALTSALLRLLGDSELRSQLAERGRLWAASRTWGRVLDPLAEFLGAPAYDPDRERYLSRKPIASFTPDGPLRRALRRLRRRRSR